MKNIRYIDKKDVENLIESKTSDDVIIFLSGPTSQKTPLSVLQTRDVIAVNGSVQYLCMRCDASKAEALPALGHLRGRVEVTTEATCKHNGQQSFTCERCNVVYAQEELPRLDHAMGEWCVVNPPLCETEGLEER